MPVSLRGVVTGIALWRDAITLQSGAESIYVFVAPSKDPDSQEAQRAALKQIPVGMLVEVTGVTTPGEFAPCVSLHGIESLGKGELPFAPLVTLPDLRNGVYDCRLVVLEGVVRRMQKQNREPFGAVTLELVAQDESFSAAVANGSGLDADLVDARVRMTGICLTHFNSRGEPVGVNMHINYGSDIRILTPAPADPFTVPEVDTLSMRPFAKEGPRSHRQRVSGVVTLSRAGEFFYVQTRDRGFRVDTQNREIFVPGDKVEAAGFVTPGKEGFAMMTEAVVRKTGRAPLPTPVDVSPSRILAQVKRELLAVKEEDYDGTLVRLRGTLVKVDLRPGQTALYLDCEGILITATLAANLPLGALDHLLPGSGLEVTGICSVQLDLKWPSPGVPKRESFSIILQDPNSIVVWDVASWWTRERILWLLVGLLLVLLLAVVFAWVGLLGATVRRQAARIESALRMHRDAELEMKAARRERHHLAADLHDGLQQLITGASYRMEGAIMRLGEISPDVGEQFAAARIAMERTAAACVSACLGCGRLRRARRSSWPCFGALCIRSITGLRGRSKSPAGAPHSNCPAVSREICSYSPRKPLPMPCGMVRPQRCRLRSITPKLILTS